MSLILLLSSAAIAVSALAAMTRQLQMLQLNSYYNSRYFGWLKTAISDKTVSSAVFTAIAVVLLWFFPLHHILLLVLFILFMGVRIISAANSQKKAIKKLVFTARVKRMYATAALLFAIAIVLGALFIKTAFSARIFLSAILLVSFLTPFFTALVNLLNAPCERLIKQWYINDAKKIVKRFSDIKIIGITGSYGKTSTKYILGRLLSEKFNVIFTPASFNTTMGVVRTIREHLKPATEIFIVEMGAKNIGDIREICELVHPNMGIITSVGPQHLQTFKTVENVLKTKFELADEVQKNSGELFLNVSNQYIRSKAINGNAVKYGLKADDCDFYAENISCSRFGTSFDICGRGRRIAVTTKLLGNHNVLNITAAAAVAVQLGLSDTDIKYAVGQLQPIQHRLELRSFMNGSVLIDDAFNANPEGSLEAVRVLGTFDGCRKIIVTPGLVELDSKEYEYNYNLGLAAGKTCDVVILVGEQRAIPMADAIRTLQDFDSENLHIVASFKDAMSLMRTMVDSNCAVLFENDLPDNYAK